MKIGRTLIYRVAAITVVLAIGALMFVIGRGHTLYFDNKTITGVDGTEYSALYRTDVNVKKNEEQSLFARERGMAIVTGQHVVLDITYIEKRGGEKQNATFRLDIPYSLDGVVINLPALLAGAPRDTFMSGFVPLAVDSSPEDETVVTDTFIMEDF